MKVRLAHRRGNIVGLHAVMDFKALGKGMRMNADERG